MAFVDLQPQKVALSEMSLSQNKFDLLSNLVNNSKAMAEKHNALTDDVEKAFTDLNELLESSQLADDVDIDKINETLTAVNSLLSEAGAGANILAGMGQVYAELNRREETKTIDVVVTAENGTLEVDLSNYNFEAVTDYSLQATHYGILPLTVSVEKVSEAKAKVYLTDHTEWEFNGTDIRFRDCSGDGDSVTVALTVTRIPVAISKTFTEADGDETTVGNDEE
jgi:hypothetical protein